MKKIAITTLSNSTNYGGILQAVALNYVLTKMNMDVTFITHQKMQSAWNSSIEYVERRIRLYGCKDLKNFCRIIGGIGKTFISNIHYLERREKIDNFKKFISENIKITPYYNSYEKVGKYCSGYDAYITGSDQVWNNVFNFGEFDPVYLLEFVNKKAKYSYGASAGGDKSEDYITELVERTKDFSAISIREQSFATAMNEHGAKNVVSVLDPTLLLTKKEWETFEKKPQRDIPEHYIIVYFLEKDSDNDPYIKKVAEEKGLPIVNLLPNHKRSNYNQIKDFTAGPSDFLYYLHHADYVITNSFHAVVFSLQFEKKFIALSRHGQESRVEDLLKSVKLEGHAIKSIDETNVIDEEIPKGVLTRLENKKTKSFEFLDMICNMEKK